MPYTVGEADIDKEKAGGMGIGEKMKQGTAQADSSIQEAKKAGAEKAKECARPVVYENGIKIAFR